MMGKIAVIDDEAIYGTLLKDQMDRLEIKCSIYTNFADFFDSIANDPNKYRIILTDRLVGRDDAVRDRFPESCKFYGYSGLIILHSNFISFEETKKMGVIFDFIFSKGVSIDWKYLLSKAEQKISQIASH